MSEGSRWRSSVARSDLRELPPSAKLVAKVLEYESTLTQAQIADSTLLSSRTVRSALGRLEDRGLVTSRNSVMDARQQVYSLAVAQDEESV